MRPLHALAGEDDLSRIFNPKPIGEPVVAHVEEAVKDPQADYDAMQRFVDAPDYRAVFSK